MCLPLMQNKDIICASLPVERCTTSSITGSARVARVACGNCVAAVLQQLRLRGQQRLIQVVDPHLVVSRVARVCACMQCTSATLLGTILESAHTDAHHRARQHFSTNDVQSRGRDTQGPSRLSRACRCV